MTNKTAAKARIEQPEPAAPETTELATQLETVSKALVQIDAVSAGIAELRAKYQGVLFDVTTTKGMKEACAARAEVREPRYNVEKLRKDAKRPIIDLGKKLDTEAERITTELLAIEEPIDAQIKAEDARKEAEKQAKAEAERKRKAAIEERIETIRQHAAEAVGGTSSSIEEHIRSVVETSIDENFAEYQQQAEGAKATTLIRLRAAHTKALAFEAEQKRLADERAENERIRLENEARVAAQRAQLAEEERLARETRDREAAEARAAQELHQSRMSEIHGIQQQVIIAQCGRLGVRKGGTIECIRETLAETEAWPITEGSYGPLTVVAQGAKDAAVKAIQELLAAAEVNAARAAEAARQAEDLRRQREESDRIERERQADRAKAEREIAERLAAADAHEQRLTEASAALERDQEALRVAQERAAGPLVDEPIPESSELPEVTVSVNGESMPTVRVETEPDPLLMTIRLTEYLPMQDVCRYAKEWAVFQEADSKADQKTDRKLAARAREAVNNLLIAVEQLL